MTFFEIIIHANKNDQSSWNEFKLLRKEMEQRRYLGVEEAATLYVTFIGFRVDLSTGVCDELLELMRYFLCTFPGQTTHLRLLRINQKAKWFCYFLEALERNPHLVLGLDLELHSHLCPMMEHWMTSKLRANNLTQLSIDTAFFRLGEDCQSHAILESLKENESLENLMLETLPPAGGAAPLIHSFLKKPNLRKVSIGEPNSREDLQALQDVLGHCCCPIEELTMVNQLSSSPTIRFCKSFCLKRPNQSIRQLRLITWVESESFNVASIFNSCDGLQKLFLICSNLNSLPPLHSLEVVPKELRILDLTRSEIIKYWEELNDEDLSEVYGTLLQYKQACPQLQIYGFPRNHRIFRDYPKFIARQSNIPVPIWPMLFGLLSNVGLSSRDRPRASPDHCYAVMQHYLCHQACGLIPSALTSVTQKNSKTMATACKEGIPKYLSNIVEDDQSTPAESYSAFYEERHFPTEIR